MCVDYTHLYKNLRKNITKKKKKRPFLNKKQIRKRMEKGIAIHRRELEPPPKYNYRAGDYSIKKIFLEAERSHLKNYKRIRSWLKVKRSTVARDIKILNYK